MRHPLFLLWRSFPFRQTKEKSKTYTKQYVVELSCIWYPDMLYVSVDKVLWAKEPCGAKI